jgi:hypothetical protein
MENMEQTQQSRVLNKAVSQQVTMEQGPKINAKELNGGKVLKKPAPSFMARWFRQYFKYVSLFVCFLVFCVLYYFVIHPRIISANNFRVIEYAKVISEQNKLKDKFNYLTKAQKDKLSIPEKYIEDIDYIISDEPNTPQILASIEDIAASSGVTVGGIKFTLYESEENLNSQVYNESSSEVAVDGVSFVEVSMTVGSAPYDSFKDFLYKIEQNRRLMDVIGIVYTPQGKDYGITLRSYYLK